MVAAAEHLISLQCFKYIFEGKSGKTSVGHAVGLTVLNVGFQDTNSKKCFRKFSCDFQLGKQSLLFSKF